MNNAALLQEPPALGLRGGGVVYVLEQCCSQRCKAMVQQVVGCWWVESEVPVGGE